MAHRPRPRSIFQDNVAKANSFEILVAYKGYEN